MDFKLSENDRELLARTISGLASEQGVSAYTPPGELLIAAESFTLDYLKADWRERAPEVVGTNRPDALGMMFVRRRRQLVYSFKLSNFLRDPIISAAAASMSTFAAAYIPAVISAPPPTFPGFLIGLAFTLLRSVGHPVGYGEAALLHKMNQIAEAKGFVPASDIETLGSVLVEQYGYIKGNNSNEVKSLIASLKAWDAITEVEEGFNVAESVPFGLGPLEYID